jgi:RNA polymerase sigma-70 factor (ECF subfamily)
MKNIFINNYRRAVKKKTIVDNTKDLYFINIPQGNSSFAPESVYSEREILKKIEVLKDEYKIPFNMYFDGYKYKEIADYLDLPIGTVKSRIFLARKQLMEMLKSYAN